MSAFFSKFNKVAVAIVSGGGDKAFFTYHVIMCSISHVTRCVRALKLNQKVYSKSNRTQHQKYMCISNWGKLVLQIGAASLFQIGAAITN